MSFFSSRQYDILLSEILLFKIVPFPGSFYTLLWNPLKHQTSNHPAYHWSTLWPLEDEFADCTMSTILGDFAYISYLCLFIYLCLFTYKGEGSRLNSPRCNNIWNLMNWEREIKLLQVRVTHVERICFLLSGLCYKVALIENLQLNIFG